jgi:predicted O-methyltransferase YrrM
VLDSIHWKNGAVMLRDVFRKRSSPGPATGAAVDNRADAREHAVPSVSSRGDTAAWFPPVMVSAAMIGREAEQTRQIEAAAALMRRLTPDDYTRVMARFYEEGLERFGAGWSFADIVTVLLTAAERLKPRRYLEVGVRRGRSACAVASRAPECALALFDMWMENYAGMANPGPDLVRDELAKVGHRGKVEFVDGNSHATLKRYFRDQPEALFDLITIDGDHSEAGATEDIGDALPRLAIGGALVLDDISHPAHPELRRVWERMLVGEPRFSTWSFTDVGYGVGLALRKW